jgi:WD40 repeat protein
MLLSHHEAQKRGFSINQKALDLPVAVITAFGSAENAARRSLDAFAGSRPLRHEGLRTIATHGGKWLATGGEDQLIQLWRTDLPDPRPRVLPGHHGEIRTLAFLAGRIGFWTPVAAPLAMLAVGWLRRDGRLTW